MPESAEKYGSAQEPLKSVTLRAIGAFGCAPLPPACQPRADDPFGGLVAPASKQSTWGSPQAAEV